MAVVSSELLELLAQLQSLQSLSSFALAGGTNLSIRYNHRESIDIDLFSNYNVGNDGLKAIENEIRAKFSKDVLFINIEDPGFGAQYCFMKSLISKGELKIKVEILQNIQMLHPVGLVNNLKLISVIDIGLMKLESLSSRKAQKDVYDLDAITDEIPLHDLMGQLRIKKQMYQEEKYRSLFDLDGNVNPIENPILLLEFDNIKYRHLERRPFHSNDILKINKDKKSWAVARSHWKRKVTKYCNDNNIEILKPKPLNQAEKESVFFTA